MPVFAAMLRPGDIEAPSPEHWLLTSIRRPLNYCKISIAILRIARGGCLNIREFYFGSAVGFNKLHMMRSHLPGCCNSHPSWNGGAVASIKFAGLLSDNQHRASWRMNLYPCPSEAMLLCWQYVATSPQRLSTLSSTWQY